MYDIYLWKIKPTSSHMTPWQSDTIYGHMLYAVSMFYGREEYDKIVNEFIELKSPFIVSDGFINERLPLFNKTQVNRSDTEFFSKEINKDLIEVYNGKYQNTRGSIPFQKNINLYCIICIKDVLLCKWQLRESLYFF